MAEPNFNLQLQRFGQSTEHERKQILDNRNAENTNKATKSTVGIFIEYLKEKQHAELAAISTEQLPSVLLEFYTNAKKTDGGDYCVQSMKCIRVGINRYMKAERGIDIISNENFVKANEMFRGVNKQRCIEGKGSVKSTPVIIEEDLERLSTYFHHDIYNFPEPRKIQQCLIFYIIYFFCRRGRENLYNMTWDTFKIDLHNGKRFIFQAIDEHDKNHGIDVTDPANEARMYENQGK